MTASEQFCSKTTGLLNEITSSQQAAFKKGASMIADRIAQDRLIYCIATGGHSQTATEEIFHRAGGLANIYPIFIPGIANIHGPSRAAIMERTPGYVDKFVKVHGFSKGDLLLMFTAYGINAITIDACQAAQELGGEVLAITSKSYADIPTGHRVRHPNNKNLFEIADHYIDCKMPYGDAIVDIPGFEQKISSTSTILLFFCIEALIAETVQELINRGIKPEVWKSGNVPDGDECNKKYLEKYFNRVKAL